MKKILILLLISSGCCAQNMTIEVDVFHHMINKIESCKEAQYGAEKDTLIKKLNAEIKKNQTVISRLDRLNYELAGGKEDEEIKNFNLTKDYIKLGKKKKRGIWVVTGLGVAGIAGAVVLKHNYDIHKNR